MLPSCETVPHARPGSIEELPDHSTHASLHLAGEDLLCELLEAGLEPGELDRWTTTASSLATLRAVAPTLLGVVGMVDVAPLRAVYRYALTGRASLRDTSAFSQ